MGWMLGRGPCLGDEVSADLKGPEWWKGLF
jgi:hypothetical protein